MKRWMLILISAVLSWTAPAFAKSAIGYELLNEIQDAPSKTYTIEFEVWSQDRPADSLSVTPKTESAGLEMLTSKKTWKKVKKGQRFAGNVKVKNPTSETKTLLLQIDRKVGRRVDTKTVSVLVAPQ